jgi:hypothetical protein
MNSPNSQKDEQKTNVFSTFKLSSGNAGRLGDKSFWLSEEQNVTFRMLQSKLAAKSGCLLHVRFGGCVKLDFELAKLPATARKKRASTRAFDYLSSLHCNSRVGSSSTKLISRNCGGLLIG